jgi:ABC-type multidrug transport system fused ATPase/permease subunit
VGNTQNQFIIFLGIFFPILLKTIDAVKNVEPNLIRAARCLGAGSWSVPLRGLFCAHSLPQIVTGIRVGLGVGWMALVAAELVGANSGLGFLINDARTVLRTDYILVGMLAIGVIGLCLDRMIRFTSQSFYHGRRALNAWICTQIKKCFKVDESMLTLKVDKVKKIYPSMHAKDQEVLAIDEISLEARRTEFCSILGHSGCGKTTLLNLIAGFEKPTSGRIECAGKLVIGPGADRSMVFQDYALFLGSLCMTTLFWP